MFFDCFCTKKNLIGPVEDFYHKLVFGIWLYLGNSHVDRAHRFATLFIQLHQYVFMKYEEVADPPREETLFLI